MQTDETLSMLDDMSKSAHGFRMRAYDKWRSMTDAEVNAEFAYYAQIIEANEVSEKAAAEAAKAHWDAHIIRMMVDNGIDRETALRWDMQAMGVEEHDWDYYLWQWGLNWKTPRG